MESLWFCWFLLLLLPLVCLPHWVASANDPHFDVINADEPRSRILSLDGNLFIVAGRDKNISFHVSNGSSILFGQTNIMEFPNAKQVEDSRNLLLFLMTQMSSVGDNIKTMESLWDGKFDDLVAKHRMLDQMLALQINETQVRARAGRRVRLLIVKLSKQIERLFKLLGTDECLGAPCKNGGSCLDGFGKYQCICPGQFQGKNCEERLDECALYSGTPLGCQNNGTCANNIGSAGINCTCTGGWHGRLCEVRENSCDSGLDICGEHGHCLPNKGSGIGYRCLCEPGFRVGGDPANPVCVDVDECALHSPCYPGSSCLNLPGAFKCGSCPAGMIGNGVHCHDFDECASELTNECSKNPEVECINNHGGYKCGPCPPDYQGDGFHCHKVHRCSGAVCHPAARCVEEPEFRCECPPWAVGDGFGPDGCEESNDTLCTGEDTCLNGGACQAISATVFRCNCPVGFQGARCEHASPCLSRSFCSGHGRCRTNPLGCDCHKGFFGPRCEFEESGCGFHTSNATGEIVHSQGMYGPFLSQRSCAWHIQLFDTRKIIRIQLLNFTAPFLYELTSKGCQNSFVNLTVFDGADQGDSPQLASQIVNLCHGEEITNSLSHPLFTSGNKAVIQLSSRMQHPNTLLYLNWTAVEPRCGGRLSNPGGDRVDYFELLEENVCVWFVSVPPQFHVQLSVDVLRLPSAEFFNCTANSLEIFDGPLPSNRTRVSELCASLNSAESPTVIRTSGPFATIYFRLDDSSLSAKCQSPPCLPMGFSLRYSTIELPTGCGGDIRPDPSTGELEGVIHSPNFPHTYFPNLDCLWVLHLSPNHSSLYTLPGADDTPADSLETEIQDIYAADRKVEVFFEQFDVPATVTQYANAMLRHVTITSCAGDYVDIVEMDMTFCNLQRPPSTPIAAPKLSLKLHTDAAIGGQGFSLRYRSVCQRDFTAPNGTISPPNYPNPAPRPFKCTYRIVATPSQAIRLKFNSIGLAMDFATCYYHKEKHAEMEDYIQLSGGHPSNEIANKRYVCPRSPFVAPHGEIVASGTKPFSITYSTSGSAANKGFLFSYELMDIGCGGVFAISGEEATGTQRQLTSPNYPDTYMAHMFCVYQMRVPPGKGLRLSFDVFDVENAAHREECDFDHIRVFDSFLDEQEHGQLLGKFCGKALPPPLLSVSGQMALVFISDRSVSGVGFSAKFQAVDLANHCDRTFTAPSGEFSFDASEFQQSEQCDYRIQIPANRRILLTVQNMSAPCQSGSLLVRNGPSEQSPQFVGLSSDICDDHPVPRLISQGNRLFLRFQSITSRSIRFSIRYEQFETGCGGHVSGFGGAISSPQFPHKDSRSLRCEWLIAVAPGNRVRLQIVQMDDLDAEDSQGRCSPFGRNLLELAEGADWADLLQRHCRKELNPMPVQSRANSLSLRYTQQGGFQQPAIFGFLAQFSTVCTDILLEAHQGTLQSPGFPNPVIQQRNCRWTIRTTPGSRIELQFHQFRITETSTSRHSRTPRSLIVLNDSIRGCRFNFLEIEKNSIRWFVGTYRGIALSLNGSSPKSTFHQRFCLGAAVPTQILSENNQITLDFHSRGEPENHFWLSWRTVGCGGPITANNSLLVANASVGADFVADDQLRRCIWAIRVPVGHSIHVWLNRMDTSPVPEGQKCFELKSVDLESGQKAELRDGVQFYAGDTPFGSLNAGQGLPLKGLLWPTPK